MLTRRNLLQTLGGAAVLAARPILWGQITLPGRNPLGLNSILSGNCLPKTRGNAEASRSRGLQGSGNCAQRQAGFAEFRPAGRRPHRSERILPIARNS